MSSPDGAAILEALADAVLVVDAQRTVVLANRRATDLLGCRELAGQPVDDHLEVPSQLLVDPWQPADSAEPTGLSLALHARRGDGGRVAVDAILAPATLDGRPVTVATLRGGTAGEPPPTSELQAATVRSSTDAIISVDLAGVITSWNEGAQRLYGYDAQEAVGHSVTMLLEPERRGEVEEVIERVRGGEAIEHLETRRVAKSGETLIVSLSAAPVLDAAGDIAGVATVARDVTERALMEDELRRSNHDLEQFAYIASHDLSEPLRVIAGFVELLARRYRGSLDSDADRFIDFIVSGVERMQALIDDLLAYSRAGRGTLERSPVDVGEVVRDVLWALGPQLRARGVEVDVSPLPTVSAQRAVLRQIFHNLISNAIKFGDASHPALRVRAVRLGAVWRFDVEDNGEGIEPRHAERVFEMFQRLHGRDIPGSGMGLAIVKRLTERLGGRVWVTAAQPKGSIFSVTIPDRARSA